VSAVRWRLLLAYALRRIGPPGWLGCLALLAAALYLVFGTLPTLDRLDQLAARTAAAKARLAEGGAATGAAALSPAQRLAAFYREFPAGAKIPDVLARLHDIAEAQKLELEIGEYSLAKAQSGRLDQFRISFPVKGPYPQVRRFAADALAALPALSLESFSLRRDKVAEGSVDGRIVFLLFLERDS
jgi:Tfp pilus assembly protein PilO